MRDLSPKVIDYLKSLASKNRVCDSPDFTVYDYTGGNYEDAYDMGIRHGETGLARWILTELDVKFEIKE